MCYLLVRVLIVIGRASWNTVLWLLGGVIVLVWLLPVLITFPMTVRFMLAFVGRLLFRMIWRKRLKICLNLVLGTFGFRPVMASAILLFAGVVVMWTVDFLGVNPAVPLSRPISVRLTRIGLITIGGRLVGSLA